MNIVFFNEKLIHRKNHLTEVSKNVARYINLKIILLDCQNNYVELSNWLLEYHDFLQYYSLYFNFLIIWENCLVTLIFLLKISELEFSG